MSTPSAIVAAFESGALGPDDFNHAAHLYLAAHCALSLPRSEALDGVRQRLKRFLARQGVRTTRMQGYHETLTRFWFEAVAAIIETLPASQRTVDRVGPILVERLSDTRLTLQYYSRDRIMSWAARTGWLAPDLQPFRVAG
jgi:hypothetical protein